MSTSAKTPSFFKVFLRERCSERLPIPKAFVALTGLKERAPEEFTLRNGRGRDWKVKTSCIDDRVFFDYGWKPLVKENALQHADFIVFTYDGSNTLKFKIYELSSYCEKTEIKEQEEHEKENDNVMAMEIEEKEESGQEEGNNRVMEEDEDEDDDDNNDEDNDNDYDEDDDGVDDDDEEEEEEEGYTLMDPRRADKAPVISKRGTAGSSGSKANDLNEYGTIADKYVHPDNPYFVAKQLKTRNNELHIPYNIIKDFSLSLPETITLCCQYIHVISPEQTVVRKNRWTDTGKVLTWKDGRVCIKEWARFCRKNKIQVNDTCICEFVLGEDMKVEILLVHVVRQQF